MPGLKLIMLVKGTPVHIMCHSNMQYQRLGGPIEKMVGRVSARRWPSSCGRSQGRTSSGPRQTVRKVLLYTADSAKLRRIFEFQLSKHDIEIMQPNTTIQINTINYCSIHYLTFHAGEVLGNLPPFRLVPLPQDIFVIQLRGLFVQYTCPVPLPTMRIHRPTPPKWPDHKMFSWITRCDLVIIGIEATDGYTASIKTVGPDGCYNIERPSETHFKHKSREISFAYNLLFSCQIVLKFCT